MKFRMRFGKREHGQGVIEFALMLPVLFIFFAGTVDFSRFIYYQTAIQSAARVGAEAASNPCPFWSTCYGSSGQPSNNVILWATTCEASPSVTLHPQFSSCTPGSSSGWSPTCSETSASDCTSACARDVCITTPSNSNSACTTSQPCVAVEVGYNFQPITPFLTAFFPSKTCWTGSSQYTLCATAVGRVY